MKRVKGSIGQQKMVSGKLLEGIVTLRLGVPIKLLGVRRFLSTMKVSLLVLAPIGSFMSIMMPPLMIPRFVLFVTLRF